MIRPHAQSDRVGALNSISHLETLDFYLFLR